jgi:hypothetical protein
VCLVQVGEQVVDEMGKRFRDNHECPSRPVSEE